jgi:hypothetical protein
MLQRYEPKSNSLHMSPCAHAEEPLDSFWSFLEYLRNYQFLIHLILNTKFGQTSQTSLHLINYGGIRRGR